MQKPAALLLFAAEKQQLFPFNEAAEISLFFVSVSAKSSPLSLSLSQPSSGFNPLIQQKKEPSHSLYLSRTDEQKK
jgi:hypothetical protein